MARDLARYWANDLARDFARYWANDWARDLASDWARDLASDWARDLVSDWARDLVRDWVRDLESDWARDWAKRVDLDLTMPGVTDFALIEFFSLGRVSSRSFIAQEKDFLKPFERTPLAPEVQLFHHACRLSYDQGGDSGPFQQALEKYDQLNRPDPLWRALARHVARQSDAQDKALLEDLARHPEKREGRLSWCLRGFIRGDLVTPDGEWLLLDDFLARHNVPPPPYLEDMPDELVIDEELDSDTIPGEKK
ncbi:MAG: hypothetical protein HQM03_16540 [Magnetococcales bacterium]|nr:hypothetical protein [Magnetococcales bacterium]